MILKVVGGPYDGETFEHDSPGWEKLHSVKLNETFYLVEMVSAEDITLHYRESQLLPPGESCRLLALNPARPRG